jgi:hypothetical protein
MPKMQEQFSAMHRKCGMPKMQVRGTQYVVSSTWYPVRGTQYVVPRAFP